MKKLQIFSSFLFGASAIFPALSITSCSLQSNTTHDIVFSIPNVVFDDYFEVDCKFNYQPTSSVQVSLIDQNSPNLRLCDSIILVKNRKTKLRFEVLSDKSFYFEFKIRFQYVDWQKDRQVLLTESKSFYYSYRSDPSENRIVPMTRRLMLQNQHFAEFDFAFYISSHISVVELDMLNATSPLISLDEIYCDVEYDSKKGQWIGKVNVNIDLSVRQISFFNFDISFSFINTFGKKQTTIIRGLSLGYVFFVNEQVPEEYFKTQTIYDDKRILVGLNDWVDPNSLSLFSVIKIPKDVVLISDDAFSDPKLFSQINKIIFNQNLLHVGSNAFSGCVNITEIDISAYTTEPEWIKNSDLKFFANNNTIDGYIWVNDKFKSDFEFLDTIQQHLHEKCGLPKGWLGFTNLDVIPDNFYEINNQNEITGIVPSLVYEISKYKIVRIPQEVVKISENSLNALSVLPCENSRSNEKKYTTRRLILNQNMLELPNFHYLGIAGPLIFNNNNLKTIPSHCFVDVGIYDYNTIDMDDVESESITINFVNCDSLETIENSAFFDCDAIGKIILPQTLKKIESEAFARNSFTEVSVLSPTLEIESQGFFSPSFLEKKTIERIVLDHYLLGETSISWLFESNLNVFKNSCAPKGMVCFSLKSRDQIVPKFENFLKNQGIPLSGWTLSLT